MITITFKFNSIVKVCNKVLIDYLFDCPPTLFLKKTFIGVTNLGTPRHSFVETTPLYLSLAFHAIYLPVICSSVGCRLFLEKEIDSDLALLILSLQCAHRVTLEHDRDMRDVVIICA